MFRYIGDYDIPYGDLLTLKHYGVVMRKGKPHVVLKYFKFYEELL